ncbi:hypothetical protein M1V18_004401 [Salmonella enterica]|nr:hypothetical protein [Salmonella enterica]
MTDKKALAVLSPTDYILDCAIQFTEAKKMKGRLTGGQGFALAVAASLAVWCILGVVVYAIF